MRTGSKIGAALLLALAIEAFNFRYGGVALDPGSWSDMAWHLQLIALQWRLLHALGLIACDWVYRLGLQGHDGLVIFLGGYFETALLLIAAVFIFQFFNRTVDSSAAPLPD